MKALRQLAHATILLVSLGLACSPNSEGPGGEASGGTSSVSSGGATNSGGGSSLTGGAGPNSGGSLGQGSGGDAASGGAGAASGGALNGTGSSTATGGADNTAVDAVAMAKDMGMGTNIGNTLENTSVWETGWGQPLITQQFIAGLASRGIKNVRVPVAWDTYATNGVIDPTKMSRVKEVVGWIEAAGMYAIVNIHWDGGWIFNESTDTVENPNEYTLTDDVKAKFASYWRQISVGFAETGHHLILEGLNEEARYFIGGDSNGQPDYAALNALNQLFVTTVRAETGFNKTRALLIAGFQTDIALTCVEAFTVPTDPAGAGKLFLSLHYYTPYTFCGLDTVETWGTPATTWGTDAEKAELNRLFDQAAAFSTSRNLPIILGEFGVTKGENYVREPASRQLWMTSVVTASLQRGIVPVLWDTGSEISRVDGAFSTEFQAVMARITAN